MSTDREGVARKIRDELSVQVRLVRAAGLDALGYLLELAWMEAEHQTDQHYAGGK
jgi:hypothetical protein